MDGENSSIPKDGKNSAELKAAGQLIGNLIGMLKAINLYPAGHQMLLQTKDKFFSFLQLALDENTRIPVRIFKNDLYCLGAQLPPDRTVGLPDFIEELQKRYVRQIIFIRGLSREELDVFVDIFRLDPYDLEAKGGMEKLLNWHGIKGLKVLEYYSRKIITLDQEKLLELTNGPLFRFLTDDSAPSLSSEETLKLYDLLKNANLICALIKVAAQFIIKKKDVAPTESRTILEILNKIKDSVLNSGFSEEEEMKEILKGTITAFNPETLFDLVFENPDDPLLRFTDAAPHLAEHLDPKKTAEMIVEKINRANPSQNLMAHTKKVLQRLFTDRQAFLKFLPAFKETLQENIPKADQANTILNDVCSVFAAEISIEDDVELSLGEISDAEKQGIVEGLETLKAVRLKRKALEKLIFDFDLNEAYIHILKALLVQEEKASLMQKILDKLTEILKNYIHENSLEKGLSLLVFFSDLAGPGSELKEEFRGKISTTLQSLPEPVLEKLFFRVLESGDETGIKKQLAVFLPILQERLLEVLLKLYLDKDMEQNILDILRDIISVGYFPALIKPDAGLHQQSSSRAMRMLDLLAKVSGNSPLPILWEMTYHQNSLIAQRALTSLVAVSPDKALPFLLKATNHTNTTLCLISIETLAKYDNIEVINILAAIALGEKDGPEEERNIKIRIAALKSLFSLSREKFTDTAAEIRGRKKFFFIPTEPKPIREFIKEQLK